MEALNSRMSGRHESSEPRQPPLDVKAFLQLVVAVLGLAFSVAGKDVPRWFFLVPVGLLVILIGTYAWPYTGSKLITHWTGMIQLGKLLSHWGEFGDHVEAFYGLLKRDRAESLHSVLPGLSSFDKDVSTMSREQQTIFQDYLVVVEENAGVLAEQLEKLVIYFPVTHQVGEAFDAGPQQGFGVLQIEDVGDGSKVVLVGFVDGGSEELRSQLLLRAVSVVHPDLYKVGMVRGKIADGLAGLLDGCDDIRHVIARRIVGSGPGPSQAAADSAEQSRAGEDFITELIRQVAHVGTHTDGRGKAVVGVALQVIGEILAIEIGFRHTAVQLLEETEVAVDVHHGGHDGFAGEVDAQRAGGKPQLILAADAREASVADNKGGVLDGGLPVTQDEPGAFEQGRAGGRRGLAGKREPAQRGKGCGSDNSSQAAACRVSHF